MPPVPRLVRVRHFTPAVAIALALGCVSPSVIEYRHQAGIDVNDEVEYYDIRGSTLRELRIDARRNGPMSRDTTFFAVTHTQLHWSYSYYRQPALCRLTNIRVIVDAIITLPRWVDSSSVDPAAVYWWANASVKVRAHEAEHLQIAVDGAAEIRSALQRMTSSDCGLLARNASDAATDVMHRVNDQQRDLDRRTRHGTVLPTSTTSKDAMRVSPLRARAPTVLFRPFRDVLHLDTTPDPGVPTA